MKDEGARRLGVEFRATGEGFTYGGGGSRSLDRPRGISVVLTGRDAPKAIADAADTVTEMVSRKQAFDRGIAALKGIDF